MTIPKDGPESQWQIDDEAHEALMTLNLCKNGCTEAALKGDCFDMAVTLYEEIGAGVHKPEDLSSEMAYIVREMNVRHPKLDWGKTYVNTIGEL
jgi:hypothetical protein